MENRAYRAIMHRVSTNRSQSNGKQKKAHRTYSLKHEVRNVLFLYLKMAIERFMKRMHFCQLFIYD